MVPPAVLPPATESTDHVTAVFVVPWIEAVNCCCAPAARLTDDGFNLIVTCCVDEDGGGCVEVDLPPAHPTAGKMKAKISKRFDKAESVLPAQPLALIMEWIRSHRATQ